MFPIYSCLKLALKRVTLGHFKGTSLSVTLQIPTDSTEFSQVCINSWSLVVLCDIKMVASIFWFHIMLNKERTLDDLHEERGVILWHFDKKCYFSFVDPNKNTCPFKDMH